MKVTVVYDSTTGDMLATIGGHDAARVRVASLEVPEGDRVDRVDLSGGTPKAVTSPTPASFQERLDAAVKRGDEKRAEQDEKMQREMQAFMVEILKAVNEAEKGEDEDE